MKTQWYFSPLKPSLVPLTDTDAKITHEITKDGVLLAMVVNGNDDRAKLIAAAPELLEALQEIVAYEDRGRQKGEPRIAEKYYELATEAIQKATVRNIKLNSSLCFEKFVFTK